jgi:hypothetical protein
MRRINASTRNNGQHCASSKLTLIAAVDSRSDATLVEKRDKECADSLKALFKAYPDLHSGPDKPRPTPSPSKQRISKRRFTDEGDEIRKESLKKKWALRNSLGEFKAGRDTQKCYAQSPV